jgi:hypothetical protein
MCPDGTSATSTSETGATGEAGATGDTVATSETGGDQGSSTDADGTGAVPGRLGEPCVDARDCESGNCSDDVCCDAACDGACDACAFELGAAQDGACTLVPFTNLGAPSCAPQVCDGQNADCVDACVSAPAQAILGPIDYVFVVDNSGSMAEEAAALENNINASFAAIADATTDAQVIMVTNHGVSSYHVCVGPPLSTTIDCNQAPGEVAGQFHHYDVDVQSLDSLCILLDTFGGVNAGGEADEWNVHPDGYGALLRPEAFKVFVVMSDDRTACMWNALGLNDMNTHAGGEAASILFHAELLGLSPEQFGTMPGENYAFYPIIGLAEKPDPAAPYLPDEDVTLDLCSSGYSSGTAYQWLAKSTGGRRYSSCAWASYDVVFEDLVTDSFVHAAVPCTFVLPDPAPQVLDLDNIRMVLTPPMGAESVFVPVADSAACAGVDDGFYVEGTTLVLCPDACTVVESDPASTLRVEALCE